MVTPKVEIVLKLNIWRDRNLDMITEQALILFNSGTLDNIFISSELERVSKMHKRIFKVAFSSYF